NDERASRNREVYKTFFTYSITSIGEFIQDCYTKARPSKLYADLGSNFTESKFVQFHFQNSFYPLYSEILTRVGRKKKKLLFSLDGFDYDFEKFKKECLLYKDFDQ